MTPLLEAPAAATEMGRDLLLDDKEFFAKYEKMRTFMLRVLQRRRFLRAADWLGDKIENLLLGRSLDREIRAPVFITGYYRSGTTMLERALSRHSAFAYFTYRLSGFPRAAYTGRLLTELASPERQSWVPAHQPNLVVDNTWPFEGEALWRFCKKNPWSAADSDILGAEYSDPEFERILIRTINKHLRMQKATRFLSKNPPDIVRVGYLARLFPDARFVHIVRHPLRVLKSQLDMEHIFRRLFADLRAGEGAVDLNEAFSNSFLPPGRIFLRTARHPQIQALAQSNPELSVAMNITDVEAAHEAAVQASRLHDRVHVVRYEDTMKDFPRELRRIFEFIGLAGAEADAVAEAQSRAFVQRNLASHAAAPPRFADDVLAELAPLAEKYRYPL